MMQNNEILTTPQDLGLIAKKIFEEAEAQGAYKRTTIKVDAGLKNYLEQNQVRDGIDKQYEIPGSSTLNNLLVVQAEDIRAKSDYYECELLVQFFGEKYLFKDLMALEDSIKPKMDGLTDLEKVEFLNSYITENIAYDKEHRFRSAAAAAIYKKGTCTAFAQLFLILGEAAGLKVGCINSKVMKHRWNYVIIGDVTYYIDTAFNASNPISNKLFFQTTPIHLEKAPDQGIAVPHKE